MDRGDNMVKISPDLTYNDPKRLGDIPYQTLFAISESPLKFGLIYVGTDDGKVHITKDGGENWKEIMKRLPFRKWVSRLAASAFDEGTVYMSQNGKRDDDFVPYLWKSTNYGETWVDISNNIPGGPINVIREDPHNKNILYVGTDTGVYVSVNGGKIWHSLPKDLPFTFVSDLVIHPRDNMMVISTHGRGMYAMDVEPIQKMNEDVLAKDVHLFDIPSVSIPRGRFFRGPSAAAQITFYLKKAQKLKLEIFNDSNTKIKTLDFSRDAGLNAINWDLSKDGGEQQTGRMRRNLVSAGDYTVKFKVGATVYDGKIEVK